MASSCRQLKCRQTVGILVLLMCSVSQYAHARSGAAFSPDLFLDGGQQPELKRHQQESSQEADTELLVVDGTEPELELESGASRGLKFLVPTPPLILPYHNGPILSGAASIPVYIIWYGTFSDAQKSIVRDFFASFSGTENSHPSVGSWWKLTSGYKDSNGGSVSSPVVLGGELSMGYTMGKSLTEANVQTIVVDSLTTFPSNSYGVYLVLTAADVAVQDFCMNSCASHFATLPSTATNGKQLPFAWVGNSAGSPQCSGMCAWPYAKPAYGPPGEPLLPPNGDVGMDGMVINIGIILAGTATDPFTNGFYQGDASAPLEAATACAGIYGPGAYSGYPGQLLVDPRSGASYNVNGVNGRKYLMPAMWDPATLACASP